MTDPQIHMMGFTQPELQVLRAAVRRHHRVMESSQRRALAADKKRAIATNEKELPLLEELKRRLNAGLRHLREERP